jgi:AcrR family transcriptional regulator
MTGKERRQQLLDIGRRLFAERGFEGTSIEEVAAQAGVSKPVVYEHFGGKEGLYAVVVDREVERLLTMATTLLLEGANTREKYEAAAVQLLKYIEDNADGFRILVRDSNPGSGTGTYGTLLSDIAGQVEYILADFLSSRGHDPKAAPLYAQMLVGMVAFTGQWWLDARKPKLEEVAANLIDLAWNGLSQLDTRNGKGLAGRDGAGGDCRGGGTGGGGRQTVGHPGPVTAVNVGGTGQAQILERRGGQAGRVTLHAEHDDPVVIAGYPRQPGVAARIEPPLQVVALDHGRAGNLALLRPLPGRPDIHQERACLLLAERLLRRHPVQPGARLGEDLLDRARALGTAGNRRCRFVRPAVGHYAADQAVAASVPSVTSPDWVIS